MIKIPFGLYYCPICHMDQVFKRYPCGCVGCTVCAYVSDTFCEKFPR